MALLDSFDGAAEAWIASHKDDLAKHIKALGKQLCDEFEDDAVLEALEEKAVVAANTCVRRQLRGLVNAAVGYAQGDGSVVALVEQHFLIDIAVRTAIFVGALYKVADKAADVPKETSDWVREILESEAGDTTPYEAFVFYMKKWLEKPRINAQGVEDMAEDVASSLEGACYGWKLLARFE